jgi:CARDB
VKEKAMKRNKIIYILPITLIIIALLLLPSSVKSVDAQYTNANQIEQTIAPTAAPPIITLTSTSEPPVGYERPVIVVNTYSISQDTISPGDSFTLYVTLYNAGQKYATNVVALFTPGDLIPRETGGVVAVGEIAPGNHKEFGQPLVLDANIWSPVTSISMAITYTDESGTAYTASFVISLPIKYTYSSVSTATSTPTQSPTPSSKPQLVITSYDTDIDPLQPGSQFKLAIEVKNVGSSVAKRVTMVVGGGGSSGISGTPEAGGISGTSGDFTNFAPIGSSNVQSIGDFDPGFFLTANQPLIVNVNTAPGAYPLKISFVYIDTQNHVIVDDQVITLLVFRLPQLEINFYQEVSTLFTGQPNTLPLQVVNLGRNTIVLGNMKVSGPSGQFSNNSILVGSLDPGGYFTLDASFIPDVAGPVDLTVTIDYTNDFSQPQVITRTLSVAVMDQPIIEPPIDGGQNGGIIITPPANETFFQKVWRFILGLIGLDSASPTQQSPLLQPTEGVPTQNPIKVPVPLKGP